MRYSEAAAFRRALEDRLRVRAGGDGARIARERKRVAFDRLLARLVAVAPGQWLLKGRYALDVRLADRARATKDVGLDWPAGDDEVLEMLLEAGAYAAGDYFTVEIERTTTPADRLGGSRLIVADVVVAAAASSFRRGLGWCFGATRTSTGDHFPASRVGWAATNPREAR